MSKKKSTSKAVVDDSMNDGGKIKSKSIKKTKSNGKPLPHHHHNKTPVKAKQQKRWATTAIVAGESVMAMGSSSSSSTGGGGKNKRTTGTLGADSSQKKNKNKNKQQQQQQDKKKSSSSSSSSAVVGGVPKQQSLFGPVGKSTPNKKYLKQKPTFSVNTPDAVKAASVALAKSLIPRGNSDNSSNSNSSNKKMSNKKKKKQTLLVMNSSSSSSKKSSNKNSAAASSYKRSKKPKLSPAAAAALLKKKKLLQKQKAEANAKYQQQQRKRIKIFQLPPSSECHKLSQVPWFCHSRVTPPPPAPTPAAAAAARILSSSSSSLSSLSPKQRKEQQRNEQLAAYPYLVESVAIEHDTACWDWLDYELQLFAQYVRLSHVEIQARDNAIHQIRALAVDLFHTKKWMNNNNNNNNNNYQRQNDIPPCLIRVEAFGSYATRTVCCFQSDIDLAIWGAVATPSSTSSSPLSSVSVHHRFQADDGTTTTTTTTPSATATTLATTKRDPEINAAMLAKVEKRKKQEERIRKWKQALANLNDAQDKQQQLQQELQEQEKEEQRQSNHVEPLQRPKSENPTQPQQQDDANDDDKPKGCAASRKDRKTDRPSSPKSPPSAKRQKILSTSSSGTVAPSSNSGNGDDDNKEFWFVLDRDGVEELGGTSPSIYDDADNDPTSQVVNHHHHHRPTVPPPPPVKYQVNVSAAAAALAATSTAAILVPAKVIDETNVKKDDAGHKDAPLCKTSTAIHVKHDTLDLFAMGVPTMDDSVTHFHLESSQTKTATTTNGKCERMEEYTLSTTKNQAKHRGSYAKDNFHDDTDFVDLTKEECKFDGETIDLTVDDVDSLSDRVSSSDSDVDSADKMTAFNFHRKRTVVPENDMISLSSSTTTSFNINNNNNNSDEEDDDDFDESNLEVSFVSSTRSETTNSRTNSGAGDSPTRRSVSNNNKDDDDDVDDNNYGPKGQTKQQVVTALVRLGNALRKRSWTKRLEIRKHARVPIINMTTATGFESDIALGGHTGMDTRLYATNLAAKYESFSTVVLALKIILNQQDLDQPFTGGLGSYKLYVLVAHHLERHLAKGGSDRPGEVLVSFLFRYGVTNQVACTDLMSVSEVESHGGTADMNAVYQVGSCVGLFHNCWYRINARIREWDVDDHHEHRPSFLASLLRVNDLQQHRNQCLQQALTWTAFAQDKKKQKKCSSSPNNSLSSRSGSSLPSSTSSIIQSKHKDDERSNHFELELDNNNNNVEDEDTEAERLMRGYGLQRGPDGTLVPLEA